MAIPVSEGRGRPARYCSSACRQRAFRERRRSGIPVAMREAGRWVRWSRVERGVRVAKMPVQVSGRAASSTDASTWCGYVEAAKSQAGVGLGFVLGAGFACVDIDHCLSGGVPDARAERLLAANPGAYVEVSPSGDGLHIWGTAPEAPGRRSDEFEFYSVGRYMTVTGKVFRGGVLPPLSV